MWVRSHLTRALETNCRERHQHYVFTPDGCHHTTSAEHFSGLKCRKQQWAADRGTALSRASISHAPSSRPRAWRLSKAAGGKQREVGQRAAEGRSAQPWCYIDLRTLRERIRRTEGGPQHSGFSLPLLRTALRSAGGGGGSRALWAQGEAAEGQTALAPHSGFSFISNNATTPYFFILS